MDERIQFAEFVVTHLLNLLREHQRVTQQPRISRFQQHLNGDGQRSERVLEQGEHGSFGDVWMNQNVGNERNKQFAERRTRSRI